MTPDTLNAINKTDQDELILGRRISKTSASSCIDESKFHQNNCTPIEVVETRTSGNISHNIYTSYFFAGGRKCKILCFILICIFTQVLSSLGDIWISYWYLLFNICEQYVSKVFNSIFFYIYF